MSNKRKISSKSQKGHAAQGEAWATSEVPAEGLALVAGCGRTGGCAGAFVFGGGELVLTVLVSERSARAAVPAGLETTEPPEGDIAVCGGGFAGLVAPGTGLPAPVPPTPGPLGTAGGAVAGAEVLPLPGPEREGVAGISNVVVGICCWLPASSARLFRSST